MTAAYELRNAGYQVQRARIQRPRRRPQLDAARRRPLHRARRRRRRTAAFDDGLYINPGPWRLPYHHRGMLDYCRRFGVRARALRPGQLQRLPAREQTRSAASRSASARSRPIITATSPSCSPRRRARARSMTRCQQGRPGKPARIAARVGRARRRLSLRAGDDASDRRGYRAAIRAAASARAPDDGEPIGLPDMLNSRLWQGLPIPALRHADHDVPAGRRHGPDRRGLRARARRRDPLQRQGDRHPPGRARRHASPTRTSAGGAPRRRAPTGACARFRCRS